MISGTHTDYDTLKAAAEKEVQDKSFSVGSFATQSEWWMGVLRERKDADGNLLNIEDLRRVELIWNYWMEEGGLIQTINALCLRFQNKDQDPHNPLANFDMSPLFRISGLLWGYIDKEKDRLSLRRRTFEYEHQYGVRLVGRAVGNTPSADQRSRFLGAFHTVLNSSQRFYQQLDNLTVNEDARPLLNALKDLHLILSEGSYNQYLSLPVQARVEMLIAQFILGLPELQYFFGNRAMTPYPQPWMATVDAMRRIMRWGDVSSTEFSNLADAGERILLAVRFGPFGPTQVNATQARSWSINLRDFILQYIHSYRAVTGVDLSIVPATAREVDATPPSVYLAQREREFQRTGAR